MKQLQYTIAKEIFDLFPKFKRGVLICSNVCNTGNYTLDFPILISQLNISVDNIAESGPIVTWRKAFRTMGIDPTKDRVSFEGLTRKLLNNNLIKPINPVVDLGNYFSVLHQCPIGAHPLSADKNTINFKKANGDEPFIALGRTEIEKILEGEVILTDETNVITRRFCWRQGVSSLVSHDTKEMFINFDFINDISTQEILSIMSDFEVALKKISSTQKSQSFVLAVGSEKQEFYF
jgi:DNA/RNA-binding domain of Phe-tRNA-synthetase-like protein